MSYPTPAPVELLDDAFYKLFLDQRQQLQRISRKLYNWSNPVHEEFVGVSGATLQDGQSGFVIPPNYEIQERIESFLIVLPIGITAANLKLGQAIIPLYSGVATTALTVLNGGGNLGFILDRDSARELQLTGTITSGFYAGLFGHALERNP